MKQFQLQRIVLIMKTQKSFNHSSAQSVAGIERWNMMLRVPQRERERGGGGDLPRLDRQIDGSFLCNTAPNSGAVFEQNGYTHDWNKTHIPWQCSNHHRTIFVICREALCVISILVTLAGDQADGGYGDCCQLKQKPQHFIDLIMYRLVWLDCFF